MKSFIILLKTHLSSYEALSQKFKRSLEYVSENSRNSYIPECLIQVRSRRRHTKPDSRVKVPCMNMRLVPIDNLEMHGILVRRLNLINMRENTLRYCRHAICRSQAVTDLCVCCLSEVNFVFGRLVTCRSFLDHPYY